MDFLWPTTSPCAVITRPIALLRPKVHVLLLRPISLNYADAQALRRAVQKLDDFDFETADKDDISSHVRAFIDTYNYTMDSAKSSTNSYATSTYKNLKNLASKYSKDLENIGIKENSSGYLALSSSAVENISGRRFKSLLNKDSKFMKQLTTYAKRMANNIDYYA